MFLEHVLSVLEAVRSSCGEFLLWKETKVASSRVSRVLGFVIVEPSIEDHCNVFCLQCVSHYMCHVRVLHEKAIWMGDFIGREVHTFLYPDADFPIDIPVL